MANGDLSQIYNTQSRKTECEQQERVENHKETIFSSRKFQAFCLQTTYHVVIDQFRYIKIQPKTTDLSTRLWGITTEFVGFIPQSLVLRSIVLG